MKLEIKKTFILSEQEIKVALAKYFNSQYLKDWEAPVKENDFTLEFLGETTNNDLTAVLNKVENSNIL